MIEFDRSTRGFRDSATGDVMRIERVHPRENFYVLHYQRGHHQLRLDIEIRRGDAELLAIVSRSHFHSQERACWLRYRESDDMLTGLRPFLRVWAELDSERPRAGQILIRDDRPRSDPTMANAIEPPSDAMLDALQAAFPSKR